MKYIKTHEGYQGGGPSGIYCWNVTLTGGDFVVCTDSTTDDKEYLEALENSVGVVLEEDYGDGLKIAYPELIALDYFDDEYDNWDYYFYIPKSEDIIFYSNNKEDCLGFISMGLDAYLDTKKYNL